MRLLVVPVLPVLTPPWLAAAARNAFGHLLTHRAVDWPTGPQPEAPLLTIGLLCLPQQSRYLGAPVSFPRSLMRSYLNGSAPVLALAFIFVLLIDTFPELHQTSLL